MVDVDVTKVSVDPGFNTAVAYWAGDELVSTVIFRAPQGLTTMERLAYLFTKFTEALEGDDNMETVYIEGVRSFQSARSWASSTRGNLATLAYIVGGYIHICQAFELKVAVINPKWKGQLTDHALEQRIKRAGIDLPLREHEREAIGLGLSVAGRL